MLTRLDQLNTRFNGAVLEFAVKEIQRVKLDSKSSGGGGGGGGGMELGPFAGYLTQKAEIAFETEGKASGIALKGTGTYVQ